MSSIKESLRDSGRAGRLGGDVDLSGMGIGEEIVGLRALWPRLVPRGVLFLNGWTRQRQQNGFHQALFSLG
jgi:hypothetical protein